MAATATQNLAKKWGPDYALTLSVEENFNVPSSIAMFNDYAYVPFLIAIFLYLPILYFGQKIMANREPFRLKGSLILWNSALAIFSIIGFARILPEMMFTLKEFGFEHSMCNNSFIHVKPAAFWIYLFVLSKTPELVDTFFLVLKKQKLIFLHVYHHATVLLFAWFVYGNAIASARWFCVMNFGVHSVMYTYYALKALPNIIKIPKWVSMVITTSQTLQMVMGTYLNGITLYRKLSGQECATTITMSIIGLAIYVSYLILFSHFFYKSYCSPSPARSRSSADKKQA